MTIEREMLTELQPQLMRNLKELDNLHTLYGMLNDKDPSTIMNSFTTLKKHRDLARKMPSGDERDIALLINTYALRGVVEDLLDIACTTNPD